MFAPAARSSSIRSSATRAQRVGVGVDGDLVDEPPRRQRLEAPGEVRAVDPEHRGAGADKRVERHDRLVGVLDRQALHHVDLGRDAEHRPRTARRRPSPGSARSSPTRSALDDQSWLHSGWTSTSPSGCCGPERRRRARGEKRWCTVQWPFQSRQRGVLHVRSVRPPEVLVGVPDPHVGRAEARGRRPCCGRGAGRGRTAPCRRGPAPTRAPVRAFDEVHTAPPCSPTNAFSAADEFM